MTKYCATILILLALCKIHTSEAAMGRIASRFARFKTFCKAESSAWWHNERDFLYGCLTHSEKRGYQLMRLGAPIFLSGAAGLGIVRDNSFYTLTPQGNEVRNGIKTIRNSGGLGTLIGACLFWPAKTPIITGATAACLGAHHLYRSYTSSLKPQTVIVDSAVSSKGIFERTTAEP